MKSLLFASVCAVSLGILPASAQNATGAKAKLVETVSTNGQGKLCISYKRYQLPNGMNVVVHEDHSDPIVYVDVTYHVGSAREQEGRSGFAHFFEHMMFQGSEHVKDEEHFKTVQEAGGTLNGSTNNDRTNYFETLPSNQLETAIWLESDRMGFLLDSVTQRKFEVQRSTVKNERGQRVDNAPYGLVNERTLEALYPQGHPYAWPVIGYIEDLNRVDVNDLKNFFMRWYGPNNATLTVAGDVSTDEVVRLAEKYFGPISKGPEVKPMEKKTITLSEDRHISYEDNVRFPQLSITYPGTYTNSADEAALDAFCSIFADNKDSPLYKHLIKSGVARSANAFSVTMELGGYIRLNVQSFPGRNLAQIDSIVNVALSEFETAGVTDADVSRYSLKVENYLLDQMSTVQGKGSMLAQYQTVLGNANLIGKDMDRYKKVTKEDVMRVYRQYIKGQHAVYMSVCPKGKPGLKFGADNYTPPARRIEAESSEYKNLKYVKATDNFDRSKKPVPGPTPAVKAPEVWTADMPNGLKMIGTTSAELPRTSMQLIIPCGHRQEDIKQSGIAQLMASMLDQSTMKHNAESIEAELEKLGSEVSIGSGSEELTVNITSLSRNIDATLALVEEKLMMPKWDQAEFDLMKKQQLEAIANRGTQPAPMADNIFNHMVFGATHINSVPASGTTESVSGLTLADVKAYYSKMFSPNISRLIVVGDMGKDKIEPKLGFLKNWKSTDVKLKEDEATPVADKTTIFLFNKEKAAQSEIRIGRTAMKYDATGEYYKSNLMNFALGGNFNSRINLSLREEHGWTYGSRSGFNGSGYTGTFVIGAPVRTDASDSSLVEVLNIVRKYANEGITKEELEYTKKSLIYSEALRYESPFQKASYLDRMLRYNLPADFAAQQKKIVENITKEDIDALAKKWLDPDHMVISIAGDKEKIGPAISRLGYKVVEVDATGTVVPPKVEEKKEETPPPPPVPETPRKDKKKKKNRGRDAKYKDITK